MKVVAFNGSPKKSGNTYSVLKQVCTVLENNGIETEIVHIGNRSLSGCAGCYKCFETKNDKCIFNDDIVNESIQKIKEADGVLLGSPVYFANLSAQMKAFIDRVGLVCRPNGVMKRKVCASVVAGRRNGFSQAFNSMNTLFTFSESIIVSSNYWNQAIGTMPGDVEKDAEGVDTMTVLGENMAWLLKKINKN